MSENKEIIEPVLDLDRGELDDDKKMLDYLNNMTEEELTNLINKQKGEVLIPPELSKQIKLLEELKKKKTVKPKNKRNKAKSKIAKASRKKNRRK